MANIALVLSACIGTHGERCPVYDPPPITEMCLHVTSYWPWDDNGRLFDGWNYQCNDDCSITGGLYTLPELASDYAGGYAACIHGWTRIKGYPTTIVELPMGDFYCVDTFGRESYRQPFYEADEGWVIPVDLLHPGYHDVICDWSISYGWVQDGKEVDQPAAH